MYSPEVGVSRQPSWLSRVDFPEPDVPIMVTNSPAWMSNDTPRRAYTVSSPTMNLRFTLRSDITMSESIIFYLFCVREGRA